MLPAIGLALALAPVGALAQESPVPSPNPALTQGAQKLSEGLRLLFQGLLTEGQEGWEQLGGWLDDLSAYEPPERLPNGDIIIRRKAPLPDPEAGETDL
ncbi:MAG TPA: AAA+ family ATPase [Rhodobacterales bacterium]|nr:AAA+ family ATPase [Rhodobacterales bacterium]